MDSIPNREGCASTAKVDVNTLDNMFAAVIAIRTPYLATYLGVEPRRYASLKAALGASTSSPSLCVLPPGNSRRLCGRRK